MIKRTIIFTATFATIFLLSLPVMADVVPAKLCQKPGGGLYIAPGQGHPTTNCDSGDKAFALLPIELGKAVLSGYDLQIVNGAAGTNTANGKGNLIIGYNEDDTLADGCNHGMPSSNRTGSHNLVVGKGHAYRGTGGIVAGYYNRIEGIGASVVGGRYNIASGDTSIVAGGESNNASGESSTVVGGTFNNRDAAGQASCSYLGATPSGDMSTVLGGNSGYAVEDMSTIDGSEGDGQTTP